MQVAASYAVAAGLLAQVVTAVDQPLNLPDWFDTAVIVLLACSILTLLKADTGLHRALERSEFVAVLRAIEGV